MSSFFPSVSHHLTQSESNIREPVFPKKKGILLRNISIHRPFSHHQSSPEPSQTSYTSHAIPIHPIPNLAPNQDDTFQKGGEPLAKFPKPAKCLTPLCHERHCISSIAAGRRNPPPCSIEEERFSHRSCTLSPYPRDHHLWHDP